MTASLIGLSSAAIVSVYALGYVHTQAAADSFLVGLPTESDTPALSAAAPTQPPTATLVPLTPTPRPNTTVPAQAATAGSSASTPTATTVAASPTSAASATPRPSATLIPIAQPAYKDGTYSGFGNSRHGGIQVNVVIQDGKIVSAAVAVCGTRYPCSEVEPLVREVIVRQTTPLDHVSGATDSSTAYKTAVRDALNQAKAA